MARQCLEQKQRCLRFLELQRYQQEWNSDISSYFWAGVARSGGARGASTPLVSGIHDPNYQEIHLTFFRKSCIVPDAHNKTLITACHMSTSRVPGVLPEDISVGYVHIRRFEVSQVPLSSDNSSRNWKVSCARCNCGCAFLYLREIDIIADVKATSNIEECTFFEVVGGDIAQKDFRMLPRPKFNELTSISPRGEDWATLHDCVEHRNSRGSVFGRPTDCKLLAPDFGEYELEEEEKWLWQLRTERVRDVEAAGTELSTSTGGSGARSTNETGDKMPEIVLDDIFGDEDEQLSIEDILEDSLWEGQSD